MEKSVNIAKGFTCSSGGKADVTRHGNLFTSLVFSLFLIFYFFFEVLFRFGWELSSRLN